MTKQVFLKDLVSELNVEDILHRLLELYHHAHKDGHEAAFLELKELSKAAGEVTDDGEIIVVEMKLSDMEELAVGQEDGIIFDVSWATNDTVYSIDHMEWPLALALPVSQSSLDKIPRLDLMVHILYELTFVGFSSSEVDEKRQELVARVEKASSEHSPGKGQE